MSRVIRSLIYEPGRGYDSRLNIKQLTGDDELCLICGHLIGEHAEWDVVILCPGDYLVLVHTPRDEVNSTLQFEKDKV